MGDVGDGHQVMKAAMEAAGLTVPELWLRYFGLGGTGTSLELEAFLDGRQRGPFDDAQHDVVAHALNERFMDLGQDNPVPYRRG